MEERRRKRAYNKIRTNNLDKVNKYTNEVSNPIYFGVKQHQQTYNVHMRW